MMSEEALVEHWEILEACGVINELIPLKGAEVDPVVEGDWIEKPPELLKKDGVIFK